MFLGNRNRFISLDRHRFPEGGTESESNTVEAKFFAAPFIPIVPMFLHIASRLGTARPNRMVFAKRVYQLTGGNRTCFVV